MKPLNTPESSAPRRMHELGVDERPQERLLARGARVLTDAEVVALVLRTGLPGVNALELARRVLERAGATSALLTWGPDDFQAIEGIGPAKACQLAAAAELARRMLAVTSEPGVSEPLSDPAALYRHLRWVGGGLTVEKFWVLSLDRRNRLLRQSEVSSGTASSSLVHPREVFREAIRCGALAVVCAHNHPSGDPSPSAADIQITRCLREAATTVDISLLDHIILGQPARDPQGRGFYSFRERGLL